MVLLFFVMRKHFKGDICISCNLRPVCSKGLDENGVRAYRGKCGTCYNRKWNSNGRVYRKFKGDTCSFCGFNPVHPCQLDVDHIDGNHRNNSTNNLQTLCANCHRLKTYMNREGLYK